MQPTRTMAKARLLRIDFCSEDDLSMKRALSGLIRAAFLKLAMAVS